MVVYSSHGIVNVAHSHTAILANDVQEPVWNVDSTLRTNTVGQHSSNNKRVITSLAHVRPVEPSTSSNICLATGFSDGTVNTWWKDGNGDWEERVWIEPPTENAGRAITDIDGLLFSESQISLVMCTSDGAFLLQNAGGQTASQRLASFAANAVRVQSMPFGRTLILVGTAHPRHNKIHLYTTKMNNDGVHHCGHLSGHQDWITCFDWHMGDSPMLASGSQDAKIRLWRFATTVTETPPRPQDNDEMLPTLSEDEVSDDLDLSDDDDDEEARLELVHDTAVTRVTLEALLLGHEEAVTSVRWHPNPVPYYGQEQILISSSMDRTLLIWGPTESGGVWTPLTRVGSAGGILGGSVGSSLLGFVNAAVEPIKGNRLLGHAYGGAIHFWSLENSSKANQDTAASAEGSVSLDDMASRNRWSATPCLTGHFQGITDMCWEAESGDYLLTASVDQTCRLWGPVQTTAGRDIWVELARPQVHGYDLNAITSVSTSEHRHLIVSGADEKELRVFDAPLTTVRMLQATCGDDVTKEEEVVDTTTNRVERAYIPSLGLSNKATAGDGAEVDTGGDNNGGASDWGLETPQDHRTMVKLPLERDLGVISLWPEVRKLFGHNTELYCLTSTVSACSGRKRTSSPFSKDTLVASSAKARDVDAASIRIWDVDNGKCIQTLAVSTSVFMHVMGGFVSNKRFLTLFSVDSSIGWTSLYCGDFEFFARRTLLGTYSFIPLWPLHYHVEIVVLLTVVLFFWWFKASSGKDRRLCLWRRENATEDDCVDGDDAHAIPTSFTLAVAIDSAHKRIIWSVHFCPHDPTILASGSRDGCIKIWKVVESTGSSQEGNGSSAVQAAELYR